MDFRSFGQKVSDIFAPPPVARTRSWLRDQHSEYHTNVQQVYLENETNAVVVSLRSPLELDRLANVAEDRGYETKRDDATNPSVLTVYEIETFDTGLTNTQMVGTFTASQNQRVGLDPVTEHRTDERLLILSAYLSHL
jgi:hypothetical protein